MKQRYSRWIMMLPVIIGLAGFPVHTQESAMPAASDVLSHVQKNVQALRTLVPDFVCEEQVTDQHIDKGKVATRKVIDSQYRVIRKDSPVPTAFPTFIESREVKTATVNNKSIVLRKYEPPIGVEGGFCNDLFVLFDKENENCFDLG